MIGTTVRFQASDSKHVLEIDDDGRVGYAYLINDRGNICGDVWLYNRCQAPHHPEWDDPSRAPFANPSDYVRSSIMFSFPNSSADIAVDWYLHGDRCLARIFINRTLVAVIENGVKPGWALLAKKDGPLAKILNGDSFTDA